ncbi:heterokaryon incompatibility protein-domain-containing protein [Mariannaea sp. PMI_226]|nr:heterokaryon incompatibility protein-domain-containing protein [Mariannaea sp. PMI_226]
MAPSKTEVSPPSQAEKDLPGHDIFLTPENRHFHSKISYRRLDASKQEIRLIKVLPDNGSGIIRCEMLHNIQLADVKGQYFSLSYCAGDPHNTDTILVDGIRCNVFANLRHALEAARHFWESRDGDFLLWADQVCINQYNLSERSQQVGFMRDIYHYSQQTLICLSAPEAETTGMEWLLELCKNVQPREDDFAPRPGDWFMQVDMHNGDESDGENEEYSRNIKNLRRRHWYRLQEYILDNVVHEGFVNGWIAFYDILESPWWSRAWVFQEFIAASDASFLYGKYSISWKDVLPILQSVYHLFRHPFTNRDEFLKVTRYENHGPQDQSLCRVIDRVEHTNHRVTLETIRFMNNTKLSWDGYMNIKQLLAHSRYCSASDDRDRIFAFLGLATPDYGIIPNYSPANGISSVLIETTKKIILFEDSLDVLSHAVIPTSSPRRSLPSWVVDWTCKETSRTRNNHFGVDREGTYNFLKNEIAAATFRSITVPEEPYRAVALEVWGIFVDMLPVCFSFDFLDSPGGKPYGRSFQIEGEVVSTGCQAQVYDQVWIVFGASMPLILRPASSGYILISCASLSSDSRHSRRWSTTAMAMELLEKGELKRQRISII